MICIHIFEIVSVSISFPLNVKSLSTLSIPLTIASRLSARRYQSQEAPSLLELADDGAPPDRVLSIPRPACYERLAAHGAARFLALHQLPLDHSAWVAMPA